MCSELVPLTYVLQDTPPHVPANPVKPKINVQLDDDDEEDEERTTTRAIERVDFVARGKWQRLASYSKIIDYLGFALPGVGS